MTAIARAAAALLAALACAGAQTVERRFEVASVKVHEGRGRVHIETSGIRWTAEAENIWNLIAYAYNVRNFQIADSPALRPFSNSFFDIVAAAEGGAPPTRAQFQEMLRALLAERFHLALHHEMRETPVYALVVGKNGLKFHQSASAGELVTHSTASGRNWQVTVTHASVADILNIIENSLPDRPVVDDSGLKGAYDLTVTFTPQIPPNVRNPEPDDVLIYNALESQLGLRLEPRKMPFDTLIVDHAENPTAN